MQPKWVRLSSPLDWSEELHHGINGWFDDLTGSWHVRRSLKPGAKCVARSSRAVELDHGGLVLMSPLISFVYIPKSKVQKRPVDSGKMDFSWPLTMNCTFKRWIPTLLKVNFEKFSEMVDDQGEQGTDRLTHGKQNGGVLVTIVSLPPQTIDCGRLLGPGCFLNWDPEQLEIRDSERSAPVVAFLDRECHFFWNGIGVFWFLFASFPWIFGFLRLLVWSCQAFICRTKSWNGLLRWGLKRVSCFLLLILLETMVAWCGYVCKNARRCPLKMRTPCGETSVVLSQCEGCCGWCSE